MFSKILLQNIASQFYSDRLFLVPFLHNSPGKLFFFTFFRQIIVKDFSAKNCLKWRIIRHTKSPDARGLGKLSPF